VTLRVLIAGVSAAVLHFVLHLGLGLGSVAPDLLVLGLLILVREMKLGWAALLGFCVGLLEDSLSVLSFGADTLALTLVAAAGSRTRDLFVGDSRRFALTYLAVGKWTRDLIRWLAVGEDLREPFVQAMLVESTVAALYLALVGLGVLAFFGVSWESSGGR
jgi:cell shape-determining protein MreD